MFFKPLHVYTIYYNPFCAITVVTFSIQNMSTKIKIYNGKKAVVLFYIL